MKPGQDAIFTISGERLEALRSSPQLEACRAKGVEVLLLADAIDEFWLPARAGIPGQALPLADPGRRRPVADRGRRGRGGRRRRRPTEAVAGAELDRLIAVFKARLGERVQDVRPSARLTESAVCLVADEHAMDLRLERFLQAAPAARRALQARPRDQPAARADPPDGGAAPSGDGEDAALGDLAELLLDQARIVEGEPLPDPGAFSRRMSAFLARGLTA